MSFMFTDVLCFTSILSIVLVIGCNAIAVQDKYIKYADQRTAVNQSVTLSCHVTVDSAVNWWYRSSPSAKVDELCVNGNLINGNRLKFNLDRVTYSLTIPNPTFKDSGTYTCVEHSGLGTRHVTELTVTVPVKQYSPTVVSPGQDITLSIRQTVLGKPVNWLFRRPDDIEDRHICVDGKLVDGLSARYILDEFTYALTVLGVTTDDEGIYACVEESGLGTKHFSRLIVTEVNGAVRSTTLSAADQATVTQSPGSSVYILVVIALACTIAVLLSVLVALFALRVCRLRTSNAQFVAQVANNEQPSAIPSAIPDDKDSSVRSAKDVVEYIEGVVQNTISSFKKDVRTSVKSVSFSRQSSRDDKDRASHRSESAVDLLTQPDGDQNRTEALISDGVQNTISSLKNEVKPSVKSVSFSTQSSRDSRGRQRHRSESAVGPLLDSNGDHE